MSFCEFVLNNAFVDSTLIQGLCSEEGLISSFCPKEVLGAVGVGYLLYQGYRYIHRPPKHIFPNGDLYEGYLVNDKKEGKGKYTYPDGACYEGDWVDGMKEGKGKFTFFSGGYYEGGFVNDKMEGKGKYIYSNGACYEGDWVDNKKEGKGKYTYPAGSWYEGDFVNDKMEGRGRFFDSSGMYCEGMWINNKMVSSNIDHLGDDLFFDLLCGSHKIVPPDGYCLGILQDYLEKKGDKEMADSLREARRYSIMSPEEIKKESQVIYRELNHEKKSKFICYGFKDHAMGLNLVPNIFPGFILCEIFNSGAGLESYHEKKVDLSKGKSRMKYKTMLQVKIPVENFSPELIKIFLSYEQMQNADEAYGYILNLPGAEILPSSSSSWQTDQKGKDCSLRRFLNGYLEYKMPEPKRMRQQMKEDCRKARIEKEHLSLIMDMQMW